MDYKYFVDCVSKQYISSKRVLKENLTNYKLHTEDEIRIAKRSCYCFERGLDSLDEYSRLIIYHEAVLCETGDWYIGYLSSSTYYRYRKNAYKKFIEALD